MIRYDRWLAEHMVHRDEIRPDPMNDNNGDVDALVEALEVEGCWRPIYGNEQTRMITGGHTLYEALLRMGAIYLPVVWGDGDEESHRRRLVADNQIARRARPDRALTVQLLDTFVETDLGLLGTGFTEDEYMRLVTSAPSGDSHWLPRLHDPMPVAQHTCPACGHTWSEDA